MLNWDLGAWLMDHHFAQITKTKSDMTATLVAAAAVDLKVGMLAAFFYSSFICFMEYNI
jgi:hypothetical protein